MIVVLTKIVGDCHNAGDMNESSDSDRVAVALLDALRRQVLLLAMDALLRERHLFSLKFPVEVLADVPPVAEVIEALSPITDDQELRFFLTERASPGELHRVRMAFDVYREYLRNKQPGPEFVRAFELLITVPTAINACRTALGWLSHLEQSTDDQK